MNYKMNLNKIKIELFDKCHELVWENMLKYENETLDESHNRHGKIMKQVFKELSSDVVAFYQENV